MLAAIAVLAIAGGVYASKAKSVTSVIYYKTNPAATAICSFPSSFRTLSSLGETPIATTYATTLSTTTCTLLPIYSAL